MSSKTCRYCGQKNLRWGITQEGWRLFDKRHNLHECRPYFQKNIQWAFWNEGLVKVKLWWAYISFLNREHWGIGW